jgi:predicted nucleotidyltransferase
MESNTEFNKTPWTMDEALSAIRSLERTANKYGLHLGLTGGVLYNGQSEKDLDVVVYPRKTCEPHDACGFRAAISQQWSMRTNYHENDTKEVWKGVVDGKIIDFFFLS